MAVNLSVKNVPEPLAARLRERAARNRRSLQRELLCILEAAGGETDRQLSPAQAGTGTLGIEELATGARRLFPGGTASSVADLRALRDGR